MFSSFWQKNETAIKVATKMSILLKTKNIQIDSYKYFQSVYIHFVLKMFVYPSRLIPVPIKISSQKID